ncbi:MAG: aminotransferase class I/II-fold pyridoxal phosphate-dependent enzyme [Chloroflexi bacterium]|nr:aminotransferase class I/II-fold pyridoxal phosphate-dependent enzyme [Chloroflexota bacterium]
MHLRPFKLERFFVPFEFSAKYMLGSSDSESVTIGDLLALEPEANAQFNQHWLGYTEAPGAPYLRAEIAKIYTTIDPTQVLVFAGAEEAIFWYFNAVLEAGDHAIIQMPCYQSHYEVARATGATISEWRLEFDNAWAIDLDWLEQQIRPNTKLIALTTPNNPTGAQLKLHEFERLVEIARSRQIRLFFDEVYRELEHDPADRLPAVCDAYPLATSLGVMSKSYGLPGLRIGWVATHDQTLFQRLQELKDYTSLCNAAPSEFLAALALRNRQQLLDRNLQIVHANLRLLDDFFARWSHRMRWHKPLAGPISFVQLQQTKDSQQFVLDLVEQQSTLMVPGEVYDYPGFVRLGFGRANMAEALARLEIFLQARDHVI